MKILLWSSGTGTAIWPVAKTLKYDQAIITTESRTQGAQAESASRGESLAGRRAAAPRRPACSCPVDAEGLGAVECTEFPSTSGRIVGAPRLGAGAAGAGGLHTRKSRTRAAMEASAATMSAAYGPQKLETRNWASAK